ncbi:MAG TPA: hypothetical protein VGM08_00050 [Candidatus Saccharimonadales bacterium]|jgi:sugar-specific transcriptional regulator TrmB
MEKFLRSALATLGCDEKQIRLFLACYIGGEAPLSELAKAARLRRSTAYVIVKPLLEKGLLSEDHKTYGKTYSAAEPEVLMRLVAARQRQIGRQHLNLEEHLGELQALHKANQIRPRVRTYQGASGLLNVLRDILTTQGEILLWTNQATEIKLFSSAQHDQFIADRIHNGRRARVLAADNGPGHALRSADAANLRETRILPKGVTFSAETYVYDHKVAVLDYNQDIIGVIIESEQVAAAHRAMFETAWHGLSDQSPELLDK